MTGLVPTTQENADNFFRQFESEFRSREDRRMRALGLLPVKSVVPKPFEKNATRGPLVAQWADERKRLLVTARHLYDVQNTVLACQGQTMLSFIFGRPGEILTTVDTVPSNVRLTIDRLDPEDTFLHYRTAHTGASRRPTGAEEVRMLTQRAGIPVVSSQEVTWQPDGSLTMGELNEQPDSRLAYEGITSLESNENLYWRVRSVAHPEFVFGNEASFHILGKLVERSSGPVQERFASMVEAGAVSPLLPLPDLASLTQ